MKKFVVYARTSTKDQNLGLESQKKIAADFAKNKGEIVAVFEEQESGKRNNRPALLEAITLAKKEGATLLIAKIDRLSRNAAFILNMKESGVDFQACDLPEMNTLTLGVLAVIAQHERELISERTKRALAVLKDRGQKLGNPNILEDTKEGRKLGAKAMRAKANDNENNRKAFQLIRSMRLAGVGWSEIARALESGGFKASKGGSVWSPTMVQRVYYRFTEIEKL